MASVENYNEVASELDNLASSQVSGMFAFSCKETYEVLEDPSCLDQFKQFVAKTKEAGIK